MDNNIEEVFEEKLEMYPHLKNIRNKLWASDGKSHVSVMIGAGFSLNAQKIEDSFDGMAVWDDIKNKLIRELNHHKDVESKDVLEIGQLYVKEYGRVGLDVILKEAVPDDNYEPDELHYKLLKLPWNDVYTTNYDTLLERAKKQIYERNYQTIYNISDIANSVQPRIIKLHGSFPANRPFVFTEKDYNEYPVKFSPFVNMVQQSIMETTFVLIGFSGDDPNFKRWTSWVSSNLGEHMSKIYMIGFGQEHRRAELEDIGITLIDFKSLYQECDQPYKKMFTDVFEFLAYSNREEKTMWPHQAYSSDNGQSSFKYNRETYPGWVVMPDDIRRGHGISIRQCAIDFINNIENNSINNNSIAFLNEILWCYDKFAIPLDYFIYEKLVSLINEKDHYSNKIFVQLLLRLLKEARLDCDQENFVKYQDILNNLPLNKEQQHQLIYEKIMYFFFLNDIEIMEKLMSEWEVHTRDIEWGIKKAVIYEKMNEKDTAKIMFEDNLQIIRKLLAIKNDDFRLLSLESVALHNRNRITQEWNYGYDRLRYLSSKNCDSNKELDRTITSIKTFENSLGIFEERGFDPGTKTSKSTMGDYMKQELLDSFAAIQLQEKYALSINDIFQYELALKNLEGYYPLYSQIKRINNFYNRNKVNDIFSREFVYKLDDKGLIRIVDILKKGIRYEQNSIINNNIAFEILSRIYFAVPFDIQQEIDEMAIEFIENKRNYYNEDKEVLSALITRITYAKSKEEFGVFCEKLINTKIKVQDTSDYSLYTSSFFEPLLIVLDEKVQGIKINISEEQLNLLFNNLSFQNTSKSTRESSLIRLTYLALSNNLSDQKYKQFIDCMKLLSPVNKLGISDFIYKTTFDRIIDPERVLREGKNEFLKRVIPTMKTSDEVGDYFREIRGVFLDYISCSKVNLPDHEIYKIWLEKFYVWWETEKEGLLRDLNRNSFMSNRDYIKTVITTLKNNIWGTIPQEYLNEEDRIKIAQIFFEIDEKRADVSIYLIPCLNRLNINIKYSLKDVMNWLWESNKTKVEAAATILYDYLVFIYKLEIFEDVTFVKSELFNMMKYGLNKLQKIAFESTYYLLKNKIDIFNISDCEFLVQFATNYLQGIKEENINIKTRDDFELISSLTSLVSYMCVVKSDFVGSRLDDWKEYIRNHKLPEVRTHADVFD
ncbi:SIR2 family protein [Paenibacillus sp. NPDC058174]|uniref:SIR2 family NAD-dependent protein deacylase n=1 Tax=Paenibacillus sp. NPDC058174 TaxID=3346366 RepID=UPI0036D99D79